MRSSPMMSTNDNADSESSNSGDMRATMNMPAVTMVAAWISAEIGVGPSMESGSQMCSGTCADLPMAPMNKQMQVKVMAGQATCAVTCTWASSSGCVCANTVA